MNHISSYPSVYALGHRAIAQIFDDPVLIEEKIDGSQFSMARFDGELVVRSKGKDMLPDAPEKMFNLAVATAKTLDLHPGWVYRCEYLSKPKHNTLVYSRVPSGYLIVFDVCTGPECYLSRLEKEQEAARIGLEVVPVLSHFQKVDSFESLQHLLERDSILGGVKIEGFVVKNYSRFTVDKKAMIGKYVSEAFKEKHQTEWKKTSPTGADVIQHTISSLKTDARWRKAVQHLRESGTLTDSPKDIGEVFKEVERDLLKEESDFIKEILFQHFWGQIRRGVTAGLPEWYKEQLAKQAFVS